MLPLVIEPAALEEALADESLAKSLLLIDLCSDERYPRNHLPGAIHVSPTELIDGTRPAVGKLPDLPRLTAIFERIGYSPDKHIVAYDDEGGGWAGRFIWTLDVLGHQHYSYLNGGIIAWAGENRQLTSDTPQPAPTSVDLNINRAVIAEKQDVLDSLQDPGTCIWDARSAEEYSGQKVVAARGGHIPGAINLDWLHLMDADNHLKLRKDLKEFVGSKGFDGSKKVITHCQTHHRSGLTYLAGKILGLDIIAYHGSWSEWGNDPDTPISTGEHR